MLKIEKTVFVSYRRTNIFFALAIHQNLTHRGYDVFFDYESIGAGDFEQIILKSIESRAHFVVILTPSALERCKEPDDWLRREIEHALHHKRNIIPLIFEGFDFKDMARYLPDHIATPLSRYNGLRVPTDYFNEAMGKLSERMNIPVDAVLHPPSVIVQNEEARQQVVIAAEPTVNERTLTASEYFERGLQHLNAGRNDAAIADYNEAIRLKPDDAEAYNNRGVAKKNKGDYDGAIADYNEAIRLKPDDAEAYNNRGTTKADKGDNDGAMADFDEAIRLNPNDADYYYNRGTAKADKGDYDGAMADFDEAIRLNPNDAGSYYNRGDTKVNKGDFDGAIVDFQKYLDLGGERNRDRGQVVQMIRNLQEFI